MGRDTAIQWADSSLNLEMGCSGCELWNPAPQTTAPPPLPRRRALPLLTTTTTEGKA
jgi:hypothetical protein